MFRVAVAPLFILAASSAAPALAEHAAPTQIVSYGDLKLADPAGARTLRRRIFGAVMAVCGTPLSSEMDDISDMLACRRETMKRAEVAARGALVEEGRLASRNAPGTRIAAR